jgi:hypothetical protein
MATSEVFNFAIMFCPKRNSFGRGATEKVCQKKLAALLWERTVSCAISGQRITLNDWVAIVPDVNGDEQPRFVLADHVGSRETWRPDRQTVEAVLYGKRVREKSPRSIPRPNLRAA